jgi:uracil-DNA glycosylase family 4
MGGNGGDKRVGLYQTHVDKWKEKGGCGSRYCEGATKLVFARGKIPSDIVFVGEGPGRSENILGKPFVGIAGKLLDHIIGQSVPESIRYSITNLVSCIPLEDGETKESAPDDECVIQCQPRLLEFIKLAKPRMVVSVGKLAEDFLDQKYKHALKLPLNSEGGVILQASITHPAALLRVNVVQRELAIKRAIVTIRRAVLDHFQDKLKV